MNGTGGAIYRATAMGQRSVLSRLTRAFLFMVCFAVYCAGISPAFSACTAGDWWEIQRQLTSRLITGKADLADLVQETLPASPRTPEQALRRVSIGMRAGLTDETVAALRDLTDVCPDLDNDLLSVMYYYACDELAAWDIARGLVETFADWVTDIALHNRLISHFLRSGWSVDRVDEWLAGMPKRKDHFWVKQRVAFNAEHGTAAPLVEDLMTSVRNHPEDTDRALALLDTLRETRRSSSSPHDLSWMADTLRPEGTTASFAVAERLRRLGMCSTALSFYEQALKTPLTRDELRSMARCRQTMTSDEMLRAGHGIQIRERMAACLLELGRADEAQELMVSAADMRKRHNLSGNMMLAGQVQRQSSQRVIQERVLEEESTSKDNPEYWQARARYYRGRGETDEERAALDRGLRLTDPAHNSEATQQDVSRWRTGLLAAYVHFLERRGQKALAVHALHEEVRRFPPDARSTIAAVSMLTMEFPDGVTGDDEVLWNWLEARPQWEYTEERLLWAMLERPGSEDVDALLRKAEHLCRQAHPSRGLAVGWVKNRLGVGAQAVPLVREALARAEERQIKDNLAVVLFKSYLDAGDWRNAEELFPEASKRLTAGEMCSWYARIAAAAAQAGARQDALRLWRGVMNANPGRHGEADVLVRAGMREDICALYRDLAARLPSASAVEKGMEGLPCARDVQPASPSD